MKAIVVQEGALRVLLQTHGGSQEGHDGVIGTFLGAKTNNADSRTDPDALKLQQRTPMFDRKKTSKQLHAASELRLE